VADVAMAVEKNLDFEISAGHGFPCTPAVLRFREAFSPDHPRLITSSNFRDILFDRALPIESIQHQRAVGSPDPATCEEIRKVPSAAMGWM